METVETMDFTGKYRDFTAKSRDLTCKYNGILPILPKNGSFAKKRSGLISNRRIQFHGLSTQFLF